MRLRSILLSTASDGGSGFLQQMATTPPAGTTGETAAEALPEGVRMTPGGGMEAVAQEPAPQEETSESGIPEGFDSWEAFGKAQLAKPKAEETPAAEEPAAEPTEAEKAAAIDAAVTASTKDMAPEMAEKATPFIKAFATNGTLTDAEVTEAAKATGLGEEMIRQYMDGYTFRTQESSRETATQAAPFYEMFGGEAQFTEFQQWSTEEGNLDGDLMDAYMDAINSGSSKAALRMLGEMKSAYEAAGGGAEPRDLSRGGSGGQVGTDTFKSMDEQIAAQSDKRYRNDPKYTAEVEAKIGRSDY